MKKNHLIIFLSLTFAVFGNAQTILYSTDFGTTINVNPAGWTFTGVDLNISNNNSSSGYTGASGNCYLGEGNSSAFTNTSGTAEPSSQLGTSVATLTLSTTGYANISYSFGMRKSSANYNTNATYTLEWSSDNITYNTITYTEATAGSWGIATGSGLSLPSTANNQPVIYFRWTFVRTGTSSNFKIDDVSVTGTSMSSNTPPTIQVNVATTTDYIDGSASSSPASPFSVSGTYNDPTDPGSVSGIDFVVSDAQTPAASLTVTATSSTASVVPNANIVVSGSGAIRNVKITPIALGYSDITVTVSDGVNNVSYVISYASSDASPMLTPANTFWHTGISDGSDAVAIDDNYYLCGDDELDYVSVYSRNNSGLPVKTLDVSTLLNLPDPSKPEVDIECATRSFKIANRSYFLGSMSNGKGPSFNDKPNRDRLFATTHTGTGPGITLSYSGYCAIKSALLAWGDANGYDFTTSAAAGMDSKALNGFSAEAMTFGPDSTILWIGLRAPLVPTSFRHLAVIAPILNFETWFNNGNQTGNPTFGTPIELDLGMNGFRDLTRLSNGTYIIVAGSPLDNAGTSAIYKWSGNPSDAPIQVPSSGDGVLNMEGVMEVHAGGNLSYNKLQIISDNGAAIYYGDGVQAKDFTELNIRKFRSDLLTGLDLTLCTGATPTPTVSASGNILTATNAVNYQWYMNGSIVTGATSQAYTVTQNGNYYVTITDIQGCTISSNTVNVNSVDVGVGAAYNTNAILVKPNPFTNYFEL
ncbi:MAG: hypothetical protein ACXVO9_02920, partial [Bacteroidia bacterium]